MGGSRLISSRNNPRVKSVVSLMRHSARAKRRAFITEGPTGVREALKLSLHQRAEGKDLCVTTLYATEAALTNHPEISLLSEELGNDGIERFLITEEVSASMRGTVTSQGLTAICRFQETTVQQAIMRAEAPVQVLVACGIQDPGNAGMMIRVADAAGAAGIFFAEHVEGASSVDIYSPKAVRATAGSLFHLPVITEARTEELLSSFRQNNFYVYGADAHSKHSLPDVSEMASRKIAWLFGNEAHGLSDAQKKNADMLLSIPIYGSAESLNVAAAAAVCLYQTAFKQNLLRERDKTA